ncbi:MAG: hypothetical protein MZW92_04615 [Comamonadaceae bacterium]|nr:hypothetical protein [Comamonadaceae bacterium]
MIGLAQLARRPTRAEPQRAQYLDQIADSAQSLAGDHLRHPGPVEDRGRQAAARDRRPSTWASCCARSQRGYAHAGRGARRWTLRCEIGARRRRRGARRPAARAPDRHQLPQQRAEVHRRRRACASVARRGAGRGARALRGRTTPAPASTRPTAGAAVPALHAGRRVDHAALRRHRAGAVDLPRAGRADGRRGRRGQPARPRQHASGPSCRCRAAGGAGRRRRRPPADARRAATARAC